MTSSISRRFYGGEEDRRRTYGKRKRKLSMSFYGGWDLEMN
jgi:hypothetical protein